MPLSRHSTALADLPILENMVLWTMRAWVLGHCRKWDTASQVQRVFDALGASTAAYHLEGFMHALRCGAVRTLEVNCVCNLVVSDDEAQLLHIISLQQQERHEDAYESLTTLTTEYAAIAGCDSANRIALTLAEAGQMFASQPRLVSAGRSWKSPPISLVSSAIH